VVPDDGPGQVELPLAWIGVEDVPIVFANNFVVQFDNDLASHIITIGQLSPPALIGSPEEIAEQVSKIEFVPVRPVARIALTPQRMVELIAVLQANVDQREQAAKLRPGDPQ
jgi:hypothetical protein